MGKGMHQKAQYAMQMAFPLEILPSTRPSHGKMGAVYTRHWVVELVLDLAGYTTSVDLTSCLAIEPAAGQGAFLVPMVKRLVSSCEQQDRPFSALASSLLAYELDATSASNARAIVMSTLHGLGIKQEDASVLAQKWIRVGDYLLEAPHLPPADFVIGNPPYIRLEHIPGVLLTTYRTMYRTMQGRADVYIAFFEAALRALKPGGVCAFICADRWMSNKYGTGLRELIASDFSVETLLTMQTDDAFDQEVSAYPALTVLRRDNQGSVVRGSLTSSALEGLTLVPLLDAVRRGESVPPALPHVQVERIDKWKTGGHPWPGADSERLAVLRYLEEQFSPLESSETGTKVGIGVATGLDEIFITTDANLVEASRLLPLALASDTTIGYLCWSGHYLVNPWTAEGLADLEQFPRFREYMTFHAERLRKRHTARQHPGQWYRTIDRVNHALLTKPRLYIPDIKDRLHPVLDQGQTYPHHNLYIIQSDRWNIEVLGGLLLSAVAQFFVECYAIRMRGGYLRFQAQYLRRIRVPKPQDISEAQAALLVQAFRQRDIAQATRIALDIYHLSDLPGEEHV